MESYDFVKTGMHGLEYQKKINREQLSCLVLLVVKFFAYLKGCQFFNLSVQKAITSSSIIWKGTKPGRNMILNDLC